MDISTNSLLFNLDLIDNFSHNCLFGDDFQNAFLKEQLGDLNENDKIYTLWDLPESNDVKNQDDSVAHIQSNMITNPKKSK